VVAPATVTVVVEKFPPVGVPLMEIVAVLERFPKVSDFGFDVVDA
jgi:hypothetical protein